MEQSTLEAPFVEYTPEIEAALSELRAEFEGKPSELIPMLQSAQRSLGYLPEHVLVEIAELTKLPPARVFGVVTFYSQFRLKPIGKHIIRLCRGTACHVSGSGLILEDLENYLGVSAGETTEDRLFTLETVACFGSCALAPVVVINDSVYGLMNPSKTRELVDRIREKEAAAASV